MWAASSFSFSSLPAVYLLVWWCGPLLVGSKIVVAPGTPSPFASTVRKTALCSTLVPLVNGSANTETLLSGKTLTFSVNYDTDPFFMTFDTTSARGVTGGFLAQLMAEVARRGGFSYRYVGTPNAMSYPSTSSFLTAVLPYVDMHVGTAIISSPGRRATGIGYAERVVDSSMVLIGMKQPVVRPLKNWAFLSPWNNIVWGCVVAVAVSYGIFHFIIEYVERRVAGLSPLERKDGREEPHMLRPPNSFFQAFADFSLGESGINPSSPASWMLRLGYLCFLYLMVASYVASLAGTLIEAQAYKVILTNIQTAREKAQAICVSSRNNDFQATFLASYSGLKIVKVNSPQGADVLAALAAGQCQGAVMEKWQWDILKNKKAVNPDCLFYLAQGGVRVFNGAWVFDNDYGPTACTQAAGLAVSTALLDMKADGTYDAILAAATAAATDGTCGDGDVSPGALTKAGGLTFDDLRGIFYVFVIFLGTALIALAVKTVIAFAVVKPRTAREEASKPPPTMAYEG